MNRKCFLKIALCLLGSFLLLFFFNIYILLGENSAMTIAFSSTAKASAVEENQIQNIQEENIKVINFVLDSKNNANFFRKGKPVFVSCLLENDGKKNIKNFKSLVRTSEQEIAVQETKIFKPGQKLVLKGTWIPKNSGVSVIACRADVDKQIAEKDERDNREVQAFHVAE